MNKKVYLKFKKINKKLIYKIDFLFFTRLKNFPSKKIY